MPKTTASCCLGARALASPVPAIRGLQSTVRSAMVPS